MLNIRYWITGVPFQNYWPVYRTSNIRYRLKQGGCFRLVVLTPERSHAGYPGDHFLSNVDFSTIE
jgi:hypothetical protein